jgi:hypothetical protein
LRAKCNTDQIQVNPNTEDGNSSEQIPKTARALEQLLFKQTKNLKDYEDRSTLDLRLRSLMTVMVRRRMCASSQRQRSQVLIRALGSTSRYQQAKNLVSKIRLAKTRKVAALNCNGDESYEAAKTFGQNLPPVVRRLYFETELVQCFEKSPVERLAYLDWDHLMEQAHEYLRDFRMWEGENLEMQCEIEVE